MARPNQNSTDSIYALFFFHELCVYFVYSVANVGVESSIMYIMSIIFTTVAPEMKSFFFSKWNNGNTGH